MVEEKPQGSGCDFSKRVCGGSFGEAGAVTVRLVEFGVATAPLVFEIGKVLIQLPLGIFCMKQPGLLSSSSTSREACPTLFVLPCVTA